MSLMTRICKQALVHWAKTGTSQFGKPTYAAPVETVCRWDDTAEEFIGPDGTKQLSRAKLFVLEDMAPGDFVYLGELTALVSETEPARNPGAFPIKSVQKTPNMKANRFYRQVFL